MDRGKRIVSNDDFYTPWYLSPSEEYKVLFYCIDVINNYPLEEDVVMAKVIDKDKWKSCFDLENRRIKNIEIKGRPSDTKVYINYSNITCSHFCSYSIREKNFSFRVCSWARVNLPFCGEVEKDEENEKDENKENEDYNENDISDDSKFPKIKKYNKLKSIYEYLYSCFIRIIHLLLVEKFINYKNNMSSREYSNFIKVLIKNHTIDRFLNAKDVDFSTAKK